MDSRDPLEPPSGDPIDSELEFHFAETVEALMERGWTEAAARREAARRFGDRATYQRNLQRLDQRRVHAPALCC